MADDAAVRKRVHVFEHPGADDKNPPVFGEHYAFTHNLGTTDILVSARSETGAAISPVSITQDENVAVISKRDNNGYNRSWEPGDRIIVMG